LLIERIRNDRTIVNAATAVNESTFYLSQKSYQSITAGTQRWLGEQVTWTLGALRITTLPTRRGIYRVDITTDADTTWR
jgi:hypothetical protein